MPSAPTEQLDARAKMAAAQARKLQKEIETTLKKVDEGVAEFCDLWEDANDHSNSNREKLGDELKKSINKLQRFRVQIREWISMNEVKDKEKLEKARKTIEYNMQRFKEFERELKTKAFSSYALMKDEDEDDESAEKRAVKDWIQDQLASLQSEIDGYEVEIEGALGGKKKKGALSEGEIEVTKKYIAMHKWHIDKLEGVLGWCVWGLLLGVSVLPVPNCVFWGLVARQFANPENEHFQAERKFDKSWLPI